MNHLTDDQAYTLAVKVTDEIELTPQEEDALLHITVCDDCYYLLTSMMAMLEVARNIGKFAVDAEAAAVQQPVREKIRAVLKLAVDAVNSALDQITAGANEWTFRTAPALLIGARAAGKRSSSTKKLTDLRNTKNFVAYDPDKKLLMIQLDPSECSDPPAAFLTLSDGRQMAVPFERKGDLFWAEISGLEDGNYEITLEK